MIYMYINYIIFNIKFIINTNYNVLYMCIRKFLSHKIELFLNIYAIIELRGTKCSRCDAISATVA